MRSTTSRAVSCGRLLRVSLTLLTAGLLPWLQAAPAHAASTATNPIGIACTSDAGPNPTFTLNAREGYIQLPDGTTMYMWSYAGGGGAFQHPGPVLCVNEGDTVTVILTNSLLEDVSIMFPGQDNVMANGAPAQPQFDGTGKLTSLTNVAAKKVGAAPGGSVTYTFIANKAGSYIYESGTMPQKQVRMGLFGALIVRPVSTGADHMYNRADSQFTPSEEFMVLLSEIDPYQHWWAEAGMTGYDLSYYQVRYWLINGRGFPDSVSDNFAPYLPEQPFGALARIHPMDATNHPRPGAIRYLNVGTEEFPYHPHGNNGTVIGLDGSPLEGGTGGPDLSMEKFAINLGPGQSWDVLFSWYDAEAYHETNNPVPVQIPQVNNQEFGIFYSGSPYLGKTGPLPPGASTLNVCGEYYIISHNHALFQMSSWGVNATGPITYVRVDPPLAQQQASGLFCQ